jgi:NitT/TauT family transport system substrate-binding protein
MPDVKRIVLGLVAWVAAITGLHAWLNVDWAAILNDVLPDGRRRLNVAYVPVT